MFDVKTNKDYSKRVLDIIKEQDPELCRYVTESQVLSTINFITNNMKTVMKNVCQIRIHKIFDIEYSPMRHKIIYKASEG